jgi:peptidyl-prolyl cis-trans isomerase D
MAVIGKIRERAGLLIGIVGFSLVAFILGDLLTTNSSFISGQDTNVRDFESMVDQFVENYKANTGNQTVDQTALESLREQAWNQLLTKEIMEVQYHKAGIEVSPDELFDMIQGKNPHPQIRDAFKDPKTGEFSPSSVIQFLKNMDSDATGKTRTQWLVFEKYLMEERVKEKYNEMVKKGLFTTSVEAKMLADYQSKSASVRYVDMLYSSVADSTLKVEDSELIEYYNANKSEFEQEASRKLEYVIFEVSPSAEDRETALKAIMDLKGAFETSTDDSSFVALNSDSRSEITYFKKGTLSPAIDSMFFGSASTGTVAGPYEENGTWKLSKLVASKNMPDSIKVSHALVAFVGAERSNATRTKEEAKAMADSLFDVIKKDGKAYDDIARNKSDDATASAKAGDLDWITRSSPMDPRFKDGAFNTALGTVSLVESNFGFHLIKVTDQTAAVPQAKVATIDRKIAPGSKTFQLAFSNANEFAAKANTPELFEKTITDKGYNKRVADNVKEADKFIAGLESPRALIQWAYQNDKGEISKVYDFGNRYVVAHLAEVKEKGVAPFDQAKEQVKTKVLTEKKAAQFIDQFSKGIKGGNIDQLASSNKLTVKSATGVTFASSYINNVGVEPAFVGTVFSTDQGKLSMPFKGAVGVYAVVVDSLSTPPTPMDISTVKKQSEDQIGQRSTYEVFNALKEKANITDNRGKFY